MDSTSTIFSRVRSMFNTQSLSLNTWFIIAVILIFIVIAIFFYIYYISPSSKPKYSPNNEDDANTGENPATGKTAELMFFFANWCPHCKTAKPIWNNLKSEYESKMVNGYKITFTEIDCSEETPEVEKLMNQYSIEGYPTIKLIKDGQLIEYDAKPTKENLEKFLSTVL